MNYDPNNYVFQTLASLPNYDPAKICSQESVVIVGKTKIFFLLLWKRMSMANILVALYFIAYS